MIFSELYSVYFSTVAKLLEKALEKDTTEKDLQRLVEEYAFSESVLTILPSLKSGKWQLLHHDLTPAVHRAPTMPLTLLEKRWLKSISDDPRLRLFGVELPQLDGVEPLFTRRDYRVFDQYADGDPYEDEIYIHSFRKIRTAIKDSLPVSITMDASDGKLKLPICVPTGFEYSLKDDKLRVTTSDCMYARINLARVRSCELYNGDVLCKKSVKQESMKSLTLSITDERNSLERAMLHFAHFEKQAQRIDKSHYSLRLMYSPNDELEMVIRVLSFGPCVKVVEPESFTQLIKERLLSQKSCGLL